MVLARIGVMGSTRSDYEWVGSVTEAELWRARRVAESPEMGALPFSVLTELEADARRWQGKERFYPRAV